MIASLTHVIYQCEIDLIANPEWLSFLRLLFFFFWWSVEVDMKIQAIEVARSCSLTHGEKRGVKVYILVES